MQRSLVGSEMCIRDSDMVEYKKLILQNAKGERPAKEKKADTRNKAAGEKAQEKTKINPVKLKAERRDIEADMAKLSARKDTLEAQMAAPDFYSKTDGEVIAKTTSELAVIIDDLSRAEERWLEVSTLLDEA